MEQARDWRAFEETVRDTILAASEEERSWDRDRDGVDFGPHTAELVGSHPETELRIRGPGRKSRDIKTWRFDIYDPDLLFWADGDPVELAAWLWNNMDD